MRANVGHEINIQAKVTNSTNLIPKIYKGKYKTQ
jgi:hypothetical protein